MMELDNVNRRRRVGVVGFGNLGQFLVNAILHDEGLELSFVWNRSTEELQTKVNQEYILRDLDDFTTRNVDLIVEVAHPMITENYGCKFLQHADYLIGSPTALAKPEVEQSLRAAAQDHGLYVPAGALWGGEDIRKMADLGTLQALTITMTKHPNSFKLNGEIKDINDHVTDQKTLLYQGPVRKLCPMAPNNVNTMAAACVAAHTLGFDQVQGRLISDPSMTDFHIVEVDVWGPGNVETGDAFHVSTKRNNPAKLGHVTGSATYKALLSSLFRAHGKGPGFHLC